MLAGALKRFSLESAISERMPPKKTRTKGRKKLQHFQNGGFIAQVLSKITRFQRSHPSLVSNTSGSQRRGGSDLHALPRRAPRQGFTKSPSEFQGLLRRWLDHLEHRAGWMVSGQPSPSPLTRLNTQTGRAGAGSGGGGLLTGAVSSCLAVWSSVGLRLPPWLPFVEQALGRSLPLQGSNPNQSVPNPGALPGLRSEQRSAGLGSV